MAIIPTFGRLSPWNKDVSSKTRHLIYLVILHSHSPLSRLWGVISVLPLLKYRADYPQRKSKTAD